MAKKACPTVDVVIAFPLRESDSWSANIEAAEDYEEKHFLKFRWRNSIETVTHNRFVYHHFLVYFV